MLDVLLGPLVKLECRRELRRGWLGIVRWLTALSAACIVLFIVWLVWLQQQMAAGDSPGPFIGGGLVALEVLLILGALILGPAFISGRLAGASTRNMLLLLLAGNVNSRDIVLARLAGPLALVTSLFVSTLPAVAALAGLDGLSLAAALLCVLLPLAVLAGSSGLAAALSCVARRGRDALLTTYVLLLTLIAGPPFVVGVLPAWMADLLAAVNPLHAAARLVLDQTLGTPLLSCTIWGAMFVIGLAYAMRRVRPATWNDDNSRRSRAMAARRPRPVTENPMLWKELHFEQQVYGTRIGRNISLILYGALLLATLGLAGIVVASETFAVDTLRADWARGVLTLMVGYLTYPLSWLIQWWLGMRAATAIVSERERDTWDALLLSPLESYEIVTGKILGTLWAMRGLLAVTLVMWVVPTLVGAMSPGDLLHWSTKTLAAGAFMTAVGVLCSLLTRSTGAALAMALGVWCAAAIGSAIIALFATLLVTLLLTLVAYTWHMLTVRNGTPFGSPWFPISFEDGIALARVLVYIVGTLAVAFFCRQAFDRLAGRSFGRKPIYHPTWQPPATVATLIPPPDNAPLELAAADLMEVEVMEADASE